MTDQRSAILTWHSLDDSGSVISTRPDIFRQQIESLAASGVPVVPLERVAGSPGSIALTFDDGCSNLAEHAFPLLDRLRLPATVFAVSGYCGLDNSWPGQPAGAVPGLRLLGWDELASAPASIEIGAHTATHPHLTSLSAAECDREMQECRREIEARLARPVRSFAYPYGSCSPEVCSTAARHFNLAVGTSLEFVRPDADRMKLPRIDMFYFRNQPSLDRLFSPRTRAYLGARNVARAARSYVAG
ncbi:MAG TPA: polysaccharide deacetylase family protein [Bryobacteraceae bacterium]|nr:polysaccharide deacetylase family protein [Bryobacteraceae bacterium]